MIAKGKRKDKTIFGVVETRRRPWMSLKNTERAKTVIKKRL